MAKGNEAVGCWQKTEEKTFKVLLFAKLVLLLLITLIVWFMYSYQFLAPKLTEVVSHGFTLFFLASFGLMLAINLATVLLLYRRQGKLCSRTNCSFIAVMIIILLVSTGIGSKITDRIKEVEKDLS